MMFTRSITAKGCETEIAQDMQQLVTTHVLRCNVILIYWKRSDEHHFGCSEGERLDTRNRCSHACSIHQKNDQTM